MLGQSPVPPAKLFDVEQRGHPWSWHEKKPIAWYEQFLSEVNAGIVVDLTPGSGAMARACLEMRLQYIGVCRTPAHQNWLTALLNRAGVEYIFRNGCKPPEQDLQACIKCHFKELVDELHAQDEAVSEAEDEPVQRIGVGCVPSNVAG